MAQQENWKYELLTRAENYIATMGTIPADQYAVMRLHPEYLTTIDPQIQIMLEARKGNKTMLELSTPMKPVLPKIVQDVKLLS